MMLKELQAWAQAQLDNTAQPEVRPDIGISVLQLVDELEELKAYVTELENTSRLPFADELPQDF